MVLSTQLITEVLSQGSHLSVRHIWDDGRKPWAINQGTDGNFQLTAKVSERNTPNRLDASLIIEPLSSFRFAKFKENRCKILCLWILHSSFSWVIIHINSEYPMDGDNSDDQRDS